MATDAELLGTSPGELELKATGLRTVIALAPAARRKFFAALTDTARKTSAQRFYLYLENVRGTRDATVLNVYINLPKERGRPGDHPELLAGSAGLYGLRRASVRIGEEEGSGLTFTLDVTRIFQEQFGSAASTADEIDVTILPQRPLPDASDIVIRRLALFYQKH